MSHSIPYTVEPVMVTEAEHNQLLLLDQRIDAAYENLRSASRMGTANEIWSEIGYLYRTKNKILGREHWPTGQ